ncbi:hypothetical protein EW146_g5378 [Bondarzewia mesenterica]|uniref:Uncharacterized protein n=1 Tax=Bondarzewia mesenterica TaxID=1095465 RepID=A0A4S4LRN5_9AGAM|nr:hypothetical protein EW146_g5378 [Bondarzewia mesenterica]
MASQKTAINYAHSSGTTCLAFSRDGSYCYTGGDDTFVRIWHTNKGSDQEPDTAIEAGEAIVTVASGNDSWFSGSQDSDVRQYRHGKNEFQALVAGIPAASIQCVAVDPAGKRIAVTSDETSVRVIDIEDIAKVSSLHAHTACSTCGADGKIIIWDVTEEEPKEIQVIEGVIPVVKDSKSPDFAHDCSAVWHPSGQYFVVATRAHELATFQSDTWAKSSMFSDEAITGMTTALALSPNGVYLASSCNKSVFVWSTQTRRLLFKFPDPLSEFVTQMAFSPTENLLAWTSYDGALYRWSEPIPLSSPDPVKSTTTAFNTRKVQRHTTPTLFLDDDTKNPARAHDGDKDRGSPDAFDDENWILDDLGNGLQDDEPAEDVRGHNGFVKEMVSVTKAQPAFQPGSTPFEHKKRYLGEHRGANITMLGDLMALVAYNMIGVIEVTDQDTHNVVDVRFHDSSARKAYHFTDDFKYDLAALGERGAIYACQPENEHRAHVLYKPYGNWASQGEWTYELDEGLHVLGVAAGGTPPTRSLRQLSEGDMQGNGNVVIATSENELTFLSGTGIERASLPLDGDFVSMVAGPEWVFVVHRDGATTMDGSQNLTGTLYELESLTVLQDRKLPIRKGHTLKWIGISEEGAPAAYDSVGVLYLMPRFRITSRGTWVRVLDTNKLERKQGKDESYWPVGLSGDTFMCLILKGRQEYPGFPRPLIQELSLCLPFRGKDPKDGPLEEHVARESFFLDISRDALGDELTTDDISRRELGLDKDLIQLIQNACKTNRIPRALDLTRMLHHTASFDMAIKVAAFYHLPGLQEKMQILKDDREGDDRLAAARDKRKRWARDIDPVPPPRLPPADVGPSKIKAFQDFGPPPAIHRPGLARATPSATPRPNEVEDQYRMDDEYVPMADSKRKRDEVEYEPVSSAGTKRRALGETSAVTLPPPKPKINPFAKKPSTDTNRNPFARNSESNKSLHKSESFFDKVDAAETTKSKGMSIGHSKASNGKKDSTRQTTLFGLPAPAPPEKPEKRGRKKKAVDDADSQTKSEAGTPDVSARQTRSQSEAMDVDTTDGQETQATDVNTQEEESQLTEMTTQVAESSQTIVATQTQQVDSPEPLDIEWAPSPPPIMQTERTETEAQAT